MQNGERKPYSRPLQNPLLPEKAEDKGSVEILQTDANADLPVAAAAEFCEEFGLAQLKGNTVRELAKLGVALESNGSVQVANGMTVVTARVLMNAVVQVGEYIKDPASAMKAGPVLCQLAKAVKQAGDSLKMRISTSAKSAPGPTRVESYDADSAVRPMTLTQINIHPEPKP